MRKFSFLLLMTLFSLMSVSADNSQLYQDGVMPVAYFSFSNLPSDKDVSFTSQIGDISASWLTGPGYDGVGNAVTVKNNEKFGQGPFFVNTKSAVIETATSPMGTSASGTVAVWVKFAAIGGYKGIIGHNLQSSAHWAINRNGDKLDFRRNGKNDYITPGDGLVEETWYHLVMTWESNSDTSTHCKFYCNNVMIGEDSKSDAYVASPWRMGSDRDYDGQDRSANADMDEVLFFDAALTEAQINTLYTEGVAGQAFYTAPFEYTGDLRPVELSNPRAALNNYEVSDKKSSHYDDRLNFINDQFDLEGFNPNGPMFLGDLGVGMDYHKQIFTTSHYINNSEMPLSYSIDDSTYYSTVDFEDASFASEAKKDRHWASVDFTIPRGYQIERFFYWGRGDMQYGWHNYMGVMVADTATQTRYCTSSTSYTYSVQGQDVTQNYFKLTDGVPYCMLEVVDTVSEINYVQSESKSIYIPQNLRFKSNRFYVLRVAEQSDAQGIHVNELRMAVGPSVWEIDSLSALVVGTDTTLTNDATFDLAALQAEYATQVQFKDVWGYDTTGVVTWDVASIDASVSGTTTVTGTVGLPTGTTDDDASVGALATISFDVIVGMSTALDDAAASLLTVYPNPTVSTFTVTGVQEASMLTVYSLTGAIVKTQMVNANVATIDLGNVQAGMYIVSVADHNIKLQVK